MAKQVPVPVRVKVRPAVKTPAKPMVSVAPPMMNPLQRAIQARQASQRGMMMNRMARMKRGMM